MLAEDDFLIAETVNESEREPTEVGGAADEAVPPPVVELPRRRRRRRTALALVPPMFVVVVAAVVLAYRVRTPDWRGLRPGIRPTVAAAAELTTEAASEPAPIVVRVAPEPDPEPVSHDPPAAPPEPPPRPPAPEPAVIGFQVPDEPVFEPEPSSADRQPALAALTPIKPPPAGSGVADPADVMEDFRREAQRKKDELADMAFIKERALRWSTTEAKRRESERVSKAQADADAQRHAFRVELARTLGALGGRAAPRIIALHDRFPHPADSTITQRVDGILKGMSYTDYEGRIDVCRFNGLPEPTILMRLAAEQTRFAVARNGPRNEDEALVRAARILLAVPPLKASTRPHVPAAGQGQARR